MDISRHLYTKKNGKLVRRKDIEKEEPTHLPAQKRPIEQNENIPPSEPLTDKEVEEIRKGILSHPALKLFSDDTKKKILLGDIKPPTEYDKFIDQENNNSEMVVKSQVAILAKESAYLALHLLRWIHEEIKGGDVIAEWYKKAPLPFTHRTKAPTYASYEIIEQILRMRGELSHLRNDFKTGYERLLEVAGKCDIERPKWFRALPVKPINDFKSAAVKFLEIVKIINSEANIALGKLTQEESGQGNISGMRWQDAQKKAESIVKEYGFRGIMKLKEAVGCAKKTLRKAIDDSDKLTKAESQYNAMSRTLKAVGVTPKVLATYREKSKGPQLTNIEVDEILAEMIQQVEEEKPAMLEETKSSIKNMSTTQKHDFAKAFQNEYEDIKKHNRIHKNENRTFFSEPKKPHQHKKV